MTSAEAEGSASTMQEVITVHAYPGTSWTHRDDSVMVRPSFYSFAEILLRKGELLSICPHVS